MQRYFLDSSTTIDKEIEIGGSDFHHIKNVMRMKIGDEVYICNNKATYLCSLKCFLEKSVLFSVLEKIEKSSEMKYYVTIAQGVVRREKKEEVIRRITELGASKYIPVKMERCVVKNSGDDKLERQKTIIKEASEQSHRSHLMEITPSISFNDLLNLNKEYDLCLFAYEESGRNDDYHFKSFLKQIKGKENSKILVVIGPEGGFSSEEAKKLSLNGFKAIGLGPRILRTETAPLYVMSAISYELELEE